MLVMIINTMMIMMMNYQLLVSIDARGVVTPVPDSPVTEEPPTRTGVGKAMSKPKGGKTAGILSFATKLLKSGGKPMVLGSHNILIAIQQSGTIPLDLLMGVVTSLRKG